MRNARMIGFGMAILVVLILFSACQSLSSISETPVAQFSAGPSPEGMAAPSPVPLCDVDEAMIGQSVYLRGTITFVDTSVPERVYYDLEAQGCRVGLWVDTRVRQAWPPEWQGEFQTGDVVDIQGQVTEFDGKLIVEVTQVGPPGQAEMSVQPSPEQPEPTMEKPTVSPSQAEAEVPPVLPLTDPAEIAFVFLDESALFHTVDSMPNGVILGVESTPERMWYTARLAWEKGMHYGIFISLHDIEQSVDEATRQALQDAVAIGFDGEPIDTGWTGYYYDVNHPLWQEFVIETIKQAVDAGAEVICLDDTEANARISNRGEVGEAGVFGEYSLIGFREYLREKYSDEELQALGIPNLDEFDYAAYLREQGYTKEQLNEAILRAFWWEGYNPIPVPLFEDFQAFQNQSVFAFHRRVITEVRAYAREKWGREVLFTTYPTDLWVAANYAVMPLHDFISPEVHYSILNGIPPRGRAGEWYKLAFVMSGQPSPFKVDDGPPEVFTLAQYDAQNLFKIRFAERYAHHGTMLFKDPLVASTEFVGEPQNAFTLDVEGFKPYLDFVTRHWDLFSPSVESVADVAVVFSLPSFRYDKWGHLMTWEGTAQMLDHLNVPYDVVVLGDGEYLEDAISAEQLSRYRLVILPQITFITGQQADAFLQYAEAGGALLLLDRLGQWNREPAESQARLIALDNGRETSLGEGRVISVGDGEMGKRFNAWAVYHPAYEQFGESPWLQVSDAEAERILARFADVLTRASIEGVVIEPSDANISVQIYRAEGQMVVHLINYDYDLETDEVRPLEEFSVTLPFSCPDQPVSAVLLSPDADEAVSVEASCVEDMLTVQIPGLSIWSVLLIEY